MYGTWQLTLNGSGWPIRPGSGSKSQCQASSSIPFGQPCQPVDNTSSCLCDRHLTLCLSFITLQITPASLAITFTGYKRRPEMPIIPRARLLVRHQPSYTSCAITIMSNWNLWIDKYCKKQMSGNYETCFKR